ncbi:cation diffusion facilitator family transporter [Pseudochelatococcus contaminans]|uniref:Cation diffusion facilitator family transporter n=1 Tax=Pseudochelatococcus contaminans TaxID=1538103 RepID=A0A7W5Z575_9HYPH|nr:cation diffusion facilitator family transporter [Pseudochelatococcus contaminans]MBB3810194.1 cation diffusion facilitator family transporter [Pseudochelatococcus contaminans]
MTNGQQIDDRAALERRKERVAFISILVSALLMVAKAIAGFMTGSLALLSDAANSLLDVGATTLTWLALREAHKPADDKHHYGHGKFESMSALAETAFLFLLSGVVAFEGVRRLASGADDVQPSWLAAGILVGAIIVDGWRWWTLKKVAKETGSEALEADALHFSSDLVNSIFVLIALGLAALGYQAADALIAIGVSVYIAIAGFGLARRTIANLLDTAPQGVAENVSAISLKVPGVVAVNGVKVRPSGSGFLGDVEVDVSRTLPLERVRAIREQVTDVLARELPGSAFTVTANPVQLNSETVQERVWLIAHRNHIPVHHVTVQSINGRLSISLDLEIDGRATLGEAHVVATRLEAALREEFGAETEVETHIEPLEIEPLEGQDASADVVEVVTEALRRRSAETRSIHDVHQVRVRETPGGLVVNYHCLADPMLNIADVHAQVDTVERLVRHDLPHILRVVGHAEPPTQDGGLQI